MTLEANFVKITLIYVASVVVLDMSTATFFIQKSTVDDTL